MAIDPIIKQKAEDIRHKIYGKEVRESLASGLEVMSEDVVEVMGRQATVEEQFQSVLDETTGKDVISAPEVILARGGAQTLGERLDSEKAEVTAQLAETMNKFKHTLIPQSKRIITDTLISSENWMSKTELGVTASDWVFENNTVKCNADSGVSSHLLWHKDRVQDGKIRITWENPKISDTALIFLAINFRAKDYKNFYSAALYSGGSAKNKLILYKVVNGTSFTTVATVSLTNADAILKTDVPVVFEVAFYGNMLDIILNGRTILTQSIAREFNSGKFGFQIPASNVHTANLDSLLSNFSAEEQKYDVYSNDITNVLVAGDSIAYEQGATTGMGWINLFADKAKLISPNLTVKNIAVPGTNSLHVYNSLVSELGENPTKYDMVIVSCGANNTRIDGTNRRDYNNTMSDFSNIIKITKNVGAVPIICTPPNFKEDIGTLHPTTHGTDSYALLGKIANGIRLIAFLENIRLVDNYPLLNNDWTKLVDDVHPNNAGYALMADNLFNVVFEQ